MNTKKGALLVALALALVTVAVYWPVRTHDFVNCDDLQYVSGNPVVAAGINSSTLSWAFKTGQGGNWMPVTWISYMIEAQLFGINPSVFHWVNLLFHAANTVLLLLLLKRLTGDLWPSAVVAGLFALHPLHVESVAWVAERKDVLSAFFGLLSLLAYVRHTELLVEFPKKAERFYILSFITLALGLMSKPMLVTWPLVMLLLDFWPLKRISQEDPRGCFPVISKLVIEKLPLFALSCISSYMAFIAQKGAGALLESLSFTQRLANALISYERYLVKTFIPQDLAVFYPHPGSWPVGQIALAMLVIVAITGLVIWLIRKAPYLAFGWAWFLGTLVPVIGLVQAGHQAMADRYSYLPLIGIFIMLVWGLKELLSRQSWRGPVLAIASVAVLVVCAILTRIQLQYWKNSITLFERAVTSTGGSVLAHVNLGDAYLQQNKVAEAMGQFTQALNLDKNDFAGHVGMANALVNLGKNAEALSHYQAAINTNPKSFDIHHALGLTYQRLGKLEEAAAHYQECNKIQPHYMPAIMSMAQVFLIAGKPGEAEKAYRYVLQNQPGFIDAYLALSSLLFQQGKADEAYKTLFAATTLAPKSAAVRLQMADLLIALKRKPEALAEYRTALLINPDFTIALNNLAWVLASDSDVSIRNGQEAVKLAQKANALTGNKLPVFLGTLAAAYAECGQFSEAIAIADKAVKQSDAAGDKKLAATNQKLLDLYRARKPVRQ